MKSNQRAHQKLVGGSRGRISTSIHTHARMHIHMYVYVVGLQKNAVECVVQYGLRTHLSAVVNVYISLHYS